MLKVVFSSLVLGSFGSQTGLGMGGLRWWQPVNSKVNKEEQEEEEILTSYQTQDEIVAPEHLQRNGSAIEAKKDPRLLGWEFKIVRTNGNLFRNPAVFQQLCEEEAEAGWILLEKLDDRRVRFKRPIALREIINPEHLSFDQYRCFYGSLWTPMTWVSLMAAILTMLIPAYLGYAYVSSLLTHRMERSQDTTKPLPFQEPPTP